MPRYLPTHIAACLGLAAANGGRATCYFGWHHTEMQELEAKGLTKDEIQSVISQQKDDCDKQIAERTKLAANIKLGDTVRFKLQSGSPSATCSSFAQEVELVVKLPPDPKLSLRSRVLSNRTRNKTVLNKVSVYQSMSSTTVAGSYKQTQQSATAAGIGWHIWNRTLLPVDPPRSKSKLRKCHCI